MIISFRDKRTRAFFEGARVKAFQGFERQAMLRLDRLHAADRLMALNTPGNRLEGLKGDRQGQYSIRINDQWRICFAWPEGAPGPLNVEIVDYHEEVSHGTDYHPSGGTPGRRVAGAGSECQRAGQSIGGADEPDHRDHPRQAWHLG